MCTISGIGFGNIPGANPTGSIDAPKVSPGGINPIGAPLTRTAIGVVVVILTFKHFNNIYKAIELSHAYFSSARFILSFFPAALFISVTKSLLI